MSSLTKRNIIIDEMFNAIYREWSAVTNDIRHTGEGIERLNMVAETINTLTQPTLEIINLLKIRGLEND